MSKFDRQRQRMLLEIAQTQFPDAADFSEGRPQPSGKEAIADLKYLKGHGLMQVHNVGSENNPYREVHGWITSKGIDFLADDGGLTAILDVVTVRLHEDTLKTLVAQKIREADLPDADKHKLLDQLRQLPGETTKHLALKLVDAGLENWHKALPLLQSMLG